MRSLAEYLLFHTTVTRPQMEEAVQNQVILGASLGAQLLELGALDVKSLIEHSARFYGIKGLFDVSLQLDYEASRLLSPSEVDDLDLIPYRIDSHTVWLLCFDPSNVVAQDYVQSKLQRRVQLLLISEPHYWQILQRYYGIQRGFLARPHITDPAQSATIPAKNAPVQDLMSEDAFEEIYQRSDQEPESEVLINSDAQPGSDIRPVFAAIDDLEKALPVLTGTVVPLEPFEIRQVPAVEPKKATIYPPVPTVAEPAVLLLDELVEEPPPATATAIAASIQAPVSIAATPVPAVAVPSTIKIVEDLSPLDFSQASQHLQNANDREAIAMTVLRYARSHFKRVMLFTVHRKKLIAWRQLGLEGLRHPFVKLSLNIEKDSVFKTVIETRAHFLGALKKTPDNIQFLAAVGKQVPLSALVLPILARGRVVNILYLDAGHKQYCTNEIGELLILVSKIGQSYEDMIRQRLFETLENSSAK